MIELEITSDNGRSLDLWLLVVRLDFRGTLFRRKLRLGTSDITNKNKKLFGYSFLKVRMSLTALLLVES